jgi:hypothetical protein
MKPDRSTATTKMGLKIRKIETPALFNAVNSKFSPNFPKVIRDDRSTDKGNASGRVMSEK